MPHPFPPDGPPAPFELGDPPRLDRRYDAPRGWLRLVLAEGSPRAWVVIQGVGNMEGLRELLSFLDEAAALLAPGERVRILIDVSEVTYVPPRVPLALGRWILAHEHQLDRAGVVVSGGVVRVLTRVVFKVAGVPGVCITTGHAKACAWLG
jgi:hypothetical protein